MKKFALVVLAALFVAVPVFAATEISTVLQATVGASLSITTTIPGTKALDPTLTSATLGNVTITSNVTNWKIVIHSAHAGKMIYSTNNYPYLLNFGAETGIDLATDHEIIKSAPQTATTSSVSVTYQTAADLALPAGTYEDTLTISLVAL
jgi:uncharacterized protein YpuA (DUF1002 family)